MQSVRERTSRCESSGERRAARGGTFGSRRRVRATAALATDWQRREQGRPAASGRERETARGARGKRSWKRDLHSVRWRAVLCRAATAAVLCLHAWRRETRQELMRCHRRRRPRSAAAAAVPRTVPRQSAARHALRHAACTCTLQSLSLSSLILPRLAFLRTSLASGAITVPILSPVPAPPHQQTSSCVIPI